MTIWQYAIARKLAQMNQVRQERELTWRESELVDVLEERVAVYETEEGNA